VHLSGEVGVGREERLEVLGVALFVDGDFGGDLIGPFRGDEEGALQLPDHAFDWLESGIAPEDWPERPKPFLDRTPEVRLLRRSVDGMQRRVNPNVRELVEILQVLDDMTEMMAAQFHGEPTRESGLAKLRRAAFLADRPIDEIEIHPVPRPHPSVEDEQQP
jgi:hypothetical protein